MRPDAVERLRDQPRGGGLPHPADAGHQEGVRQSAALDRVGQRLDHRVLPDELSKRLRPVFPGEDAVRLPALVLGGRGTRWGRFRCPDHGVLARRFQLCSRRSGFFLRRLHAEDIG